MNEEEINKMCSDIYEGEDWQPMKDYIKSLQTQLQQKDKEIERLNKENKILRENAEHNDKVVDKVNWGNKRLNNIMTELEEYICAIEYDERHSECWEIPVRIHNKLKELKGSDKE